MHDAVHVFRLYDIYATLSWEPPMSNLKRIQFSATIAAPVSMVYELMIAPDSYRDWSAAFAEGSRYEGSWETGQRLRFLAEVGGGMVSEIAENRRNEFISIKHLGYIVDGKEDTDSEAIRAWAPAYENYTFQSVPEGTRLVIDQDATAEFESYLVDAWPKALERLKALCEATADKSAPGLSHPPKGMGWGWD